jgi:hypothetical protein
VESNITHITQALYTAFREAAQCFWILYLIAAVDGKGADLVYGKVGEEIDKDIMFNVLDNGEGFSNLIGFVIHPSIAIGPVFWKMLIYPMKKDVV